MNKMARPMMTVVRFGAEDVIATSSRVISGSGSYSAMGSEIQEYSNTPGSSIYGYSFSNNDTLYSITFSDFGVQVLPENDSNPYAWYNEADGYWLTDEQTIDHYNGNLPK